MTNESLTGQQLSKALAENTLTPQATMTAMVRKSNDNGCVDITLSDCEAWIAIPEELINAKVIGSRKCKDHTHPLVELQLKQPNEPTAKALFHLVVQLLQHQSLFDPPEPILCSTSVVAHCQDGRFEQGVTPYKRSGCNCGAAKVRAAQKCGSRPLSYSDCEYDVLS
jgi:hypothetical protein